MIAAKISFQHSGKLDRNHVHPLILKIRVQTFVHLGISVKPFRFGELHRTGMYRQNRNHVHPLILKIRVRTFSLSRAGSLLSAVYLKPCGGTVGISCPPYYSQR